MMPTFIAIPEKTQSKTAMKKVLDYVMHDKKTLYQNQETGRSYKLISGQNCMPETAHKEFTNTKEQYKKAKGVFFKQYVQSFKPDCGATPEQIHQMGVELAMQFDGYEVVIATHVDADHWHNHLVVNSVSCETGLKIQINEKGLEQLRQKSDEICQQYGFEILNPYKKPKQRSMNQREYRAALKGNSWKMKLLSAIDKSMKAAGSKDQFIGNMKKLGYNVKWIDHYKYITYTTADSHKCRDNRLYDDKYLKSNMEVYFNGLEQANGNQRGNQRDIDRAVSANIDWSKARPMERPDKARNDGRDGISQEHRPDVQTAHTSQNRPFDDRRSAEALSMDNAGSQRRDRPDGQQYELQDEKLNQYSGQYDDEFDFEYDGADENEGFDTVENQSKVDHNWGDIANSVIALGDSIETMVDKKTAEKRKQKKYAPAKSQKKNQHKSHDRGMEL